MSSDLDDSYSLPGFTSYQLMSLHSAHQSAIRTLSLQRGMVLRTLGYGGYRGKFVVNIRKKQVQVSTGGPTSVTSLDRPVASSRFLLPPWPDPSKRGPLELATGSFLILPQWFVILELKEYQKAKYYSFWCKLRP